jgi:LmbE family N-acetylglucosaminyl deacetylase
VSRGAPRRGARAQTAGGAGAKGPAVFVLAHHDDEVFCAGHLRQAMDEGRPLRVLWATAGGLAPARRRLAEGRRVQALLALPDPAVRDLMLRDQGALRQVDLIAWAVDALVGDDDGGHDAGDGEPATAGDSESTAAVVYAPAYEGGHPDHDAVNLALAVLRVRRPALRVREFPLYRRSRAGLSVQALAPSGAPAGERDVLRLGETALALRRRLVRANRSQAAVSLLPLLALAWAAGRGRTEESRPLPAHDYARPPQPRPLLYELYTRRRFDEFRCVAAEALAAAREAAGVPRARPSGRPDGD